MVGMEGIAWGVGDGNVGGRGVVGWGTETQRDALTGNRRIFRGGFFLRWPVHDTAQSSTCHDPRDPVRAHTPYCSGNLARHEETVGLPNRHSA